MKVKILRPYIHRGVIGTIDGTRFKYPCQSFWVTPVMGDDGRKYLALEYEELSYPEPEYYI